MKLNVKIALPILLLLTIIVIAFGYILFFIDTEVNTVAKDTVKFKELSKLTEELSNEQEFTQQNTLKYIFSLDQTLLNEISKSEAQKLQIIENINKLLETEESKNKADRYLMEREISNKVRDEFLNALASKNTSLIEQKYKIWISQTERVHNAIRELHTINESSLADVFQKFKVTSERIAAVVIGLLILIVLIIFIFYYFLRHTITSPIFKLSNFADEVAQKNFTNIMDDNVIRKDEIGNLFRAFINMSKNLKNYYTELEQKVQDRTTELTNRTKELENSQKATLNILEDLDKERQVLVETKAIDEAILTSIADGLAVIDVDGKITYVNEAFEIITGWKSQEVINKSFDEIVPSEDEKGEQIKSKNRFVYRILNGENPDDNLQHTVYYLRKNGSRFPVSSLVKRITLNNKTIGVVKTFRDATREKDIDKAKTEFVALAAHQLRTPLSAISWYTEMLLEGDAGELGETQKKYLMQIYQGNQRMIDMVKSFLNVSRIDMGSMEMEKQKVNIQKLLQSVIDEQNVKMIAKHIKFSFDYDQNIPDLETDLNRTRMVFQNLLSNSIKYTKEKGEIKITASLDDANKNILIQFYDNGFGIPDTSHPQIFSKLYRAPNVIEKATEGTGLGLYIVKNIVENSGGKIWFESTENVGTTFFLSFPI